MASVLQWQHPWQQGFSFSGNHRVDAARFAALTPEQRTRIGWFDYHSPFRTGIPEIDHSATLFTILREPVARVVSFMHHVWDGKSPGLSEFSGGDRFPVTAFLRDPIPELQNLQTKMMLNTSSCTSPEELKRLGHDAALELATEHLLEGMAAFGLQEELDASLLLMQQPLGWRTPLYVSRNRRSSVGQISLTPAQRRRIEGLNSLDMRLYAQARTHFDQRKRRAGITSDAVARFARQRRATAPVVQTTALARRGVTRLQNRTGGRI
ncbi:MAG: sulfotransferase family protein [Actinomycetia bacterium]|nr:sulfotransferase family protein [Actinomycetes bacterium]